MKWNCHQVGLTLAKANSDYWFNLTVSIYLCSMDIKCLVHEVKAVIGYLLMCNSLIAMFNT